MLRGGKPFQAQLLLSPAPGGVVAVVRDVAVSQEVADAAVRAEDLARFASLVAHEIRNPLSAVKIALQTLERHGTLAANDLRRTSIALDWAQPTARVASPPLCTVSNRCRKNAPASAVPTPGRRQAQGCGAPEGLRS